jgi:hypothetical protein
LFSFHPQSPRNQRSADFYLRTVVLPKRKSA